MPIAAGESSINGESGREAVSSQLTGSGSDETTAGEYGANEWLVDEMYEKYLADPDSVDQTWWPVLEHYRQVRTGATAEAAASQPTDAASAPAPAAPAAPQPTDAASAPAPAAPAAPAATAPSDAPITAPSPIIGQAPAARTTSVAPRTAPVPADVPITSPQPVVAGAPLADEVVALRGLPKTLAANMDQSLTVPTATSVRTIPAKLMIDNRIVINNHLRRSRGGKVSFTHLIGWALIQALKDFPSQNVYYAEPDGKPSMVKPAHIGLGIAIDIPKPDGTRALLVPAIKRAETMTFNEYLTAYEDLVTRARQNKLTADDFSGATISLTNPGGIGTVHSVPRLMKGQGCIIGAGALEYPAEFQGSSEKTLANLAIGKTITLTSTYDHRVIQGAGSGEFLKKVHELLIGQRDFYEDLFAALRLPYEPIRWAPDISVDIASAIDKTARVQELINAFRVRGHLMADIDPLEYVQRSHPDLDIASHGLTFWDLDREFVTGGFGDKRTALLRDILGVLRDSYCRTIGIEYMHIQDPVQRKWIQNEVERKYEKPTHDEQMRILGKLNEAEAFETFLQTKYVGQKRFSLEGGESVIALLDVILQGAAKDGLDEVAIGMAHRGRLNVLTNIGGKTYGQVFREFEGRQESKSFSGSGDVKYHLGTEGTFTADDGHQIPVSLAANPSHLEAVDGVLEGIVRAKQDRKPIGTFSTLPILDPRRRGHGRPGHRGRDHADVAAARLPHRRHDPRRRQQPGRIHHGAGRRAFVDLLHGCREDHPGPDLPRERRRPRVRRAGRRARVPLSAGVQARRRHRPRLLPTPRPQRGRRPLDDAAAHVQPHRGEALGSKALHRGARRPRRHHRGGVRGGAPRLPGPPRARLRRDARRPDGRDPDHRRHRVHPRRGGRLG